MSDKVGGYYNEPILWKSYLFRINIKRKDYYVSDYILYILT